MESHAEDHEGVSPNIGAAYEITVFDKDGNVKQVVKDDAKCFVMNFLRIIQNLILNGRDVEYHQYWAATTSMRNLTGEMVSTYGISASYDIYGSFLANALDGDVTKGIVVGSGNIPVTEDDYALGTIIQHGSGSNQLSYGGVAISPPSTVGSVITVTTSRMFYNTGVDAVPVSEIGLYQKGQITIMTLRDIISQILLNPGESMLVGYKIILNG
jgi:hypothetical protein